MEVLSLLKSKNACLKRFLALSRELDLAQLDTELGEFQEKRESILKAIELFDKRITMNIRELPSHVRTDTFAREVKSALEESDSLLSEIFLADQRVTHAIEAEKAKILREAASSHKNIAQLQKFKSQWVAEASSGEGLDETL